MSVIFFDTDCELWYTQADELGCPVIKMPYTIDGEEYFYDLGRDTDFKGFYTKIRNGSMPVTSALNPTQYIEIFEPYFAKGEEILYISFSSEMSGTFGHLETALKELNEKYPNVKFTRFDTKSICFGSGYQVYFAVKFFQEGHTIEETIEYLNVLTKQVGIYFMVDNLMHLFRGGRLSKTSAVLGSVLGVKPLLTINNQGKLEVVDKVKGEKKAVNYFLQKMESEGEDIENWPVVILDADNEELGTRVENAVREKYPKAEIWRYPVGPVIGAHAGPGTIAVVFHSAKK